MNLDCLEKSRLKGQYASRAIKPLEVYCETWNIPEDRAIEFLLGDIMFLCDAMDEDGEKLIQLVIKRVLRLS